MKPENNVSTELLLNNVESWLQSHEPENLVMLGDRFLVRTVVHHPELQTLLARGPEIIQALSEASSHVEMVNDPGSCLVLLWCLEDAGLDVSAGRAGLESLRDFWEPFIRGAMEPLRSVIRYWQYRNGFLSSFEPGLPPPNEFFRFYHIVHSVFYKGDYGRKTVDPASISEDRYNAHVMADRFRKNPDVIAELLLMEVMLSPDNEYVIAHLIQELIALLENDGRLRVPGGDSIQADHHATCVTSLALHLLAQKPQTPPA
jgi:hypothetical protein